MIKYFSTLISFCIISCSLLYSQNYVMGAILDPSRYEQTNSKPVLLSRDYTAIPPSVSLKRYAPLPGDQGNYGTCVAWSSAFAARTISESLALQRTGPKNNLNNVFSPAYVYINASGDPSFNRGMHIFDALDLMKEGGIVKRLPIEENTDLRKLSLDIYDDARRYSISDYVKLFSNDARRPGTISKRVLPVKKSLAAGKPVIIGMMCPESFVEAEGGWEPWENPNGYYPGHAMCVVGYDDNMYGGAFEIQNSWGTDWGNKGYIWIKYSDFANFVDEAYELIESLSSYEDTAQFSAAIEIQLYGRSEGMPVTFNRSGFYRTRSSYPSGTRFRFVMTNKHPSYVYAFAADDSTAETERIFPLRGVSPVIDYGDSTIAWPGETEWIRMNETVGTDYLVVLYSKEALDADLIQERFAAESGALQERIAKAVGPNFIPYNEVQFDNNVINFSASSVNQKAVFGLLLAIDHSAP